MTEVRCPKCFIRFTPNRARSATRQRAEHLEDMHIDENTVIVPAPRPTDEQAKPNSYRTEKCIACGETVRDPCWNSSVGGGSEKDRASAVAGNPIRQSKFWTKRKVEIEISTWIGIGAGASHYYFKLEEDDDDPIILYQSFDADPPRAVVRNIHSWGDPGHGRRIDDNHDQFTMESAMQEAVRKYLEKFDCKTHYLVHHYSHHTEEKELARKIIRGMREGD